MVAAVTGDGFSSGLYFGSVVHERLRPVRHRFKYPVWSLLADLDELPGLDARFTFFSFNRPNVMCFLERDHGPRDGSPLRPWIEGHLRTLGVDLRGGPVRLLCVPRILGFAFNPLTVWFCHERGGRLVALLLQVSNMSGEWHNYAFSVAGAGEDGVHSAEFEKRFSVSAFTRMRARYECAVVEPGDLVEVRIRETEADGDTLLASWSGRRRELTSGSLSYALGGYPLMTFRIWAAIYWQALRLLGKGTPRPAQARGASGEITFPSSRAVGPAGARAIPAAGPDRP